MMGYGYGMGGFWGFGMMAFWILVVVGVVLLIRWYASETRGNPSVLYGKGAVARNHELEIARERFAKGEINLDEYGAIRRGLE